MSPEVLSQLTRARLLAYLGTSASGLLVPVLVWRSTRSSALMGAALACEWGPKLVAYLRGGALIDRLGARGAHRAVDLGRLVSLAALAWACATGTWQLAVASAVVTQALGALSNIFFEALVGEGGARGHARLSTADMAAAALMVPGTLLLSEAGLAALCSLAYLVCLGLSWGPLERAGVYDGFAPGRAAPMSLGTCVKRVRASAALSRLVVGGLALGVPVALAAAALPALLEAASPGWGEARALAMFGLIRALSAIAAVRLAESWRPRRVAAVSAWLIGCAWIGLALCPVGPGIAACVLAASVLHATYTPWARQVRQEQLAERERRSMTGALIAVEASAYLGASALLGLELAEPRLVAAGAGVALSMVALGALAPLLRGAAAGRGS